jgi:hypothetical protein
MRVRSTYDEINEDWSQTKVVTDQHCDVDDTVVTTYTNGTDIHKVNSRTMTDVVTPNFKALIASGAIVNSPMTSSTVETTYGVSTRNHEYSYEKWSACNPYRWLSSVGKSSGGYVTPIEWRTLLPYTPVDLDDLRALAVTRVYANAQLTQAQTQVMLAEGKKTVASLYSIGKRLLKIFRYLRLRKATLNGERFFAKRLATEYTPAALADRYMELRYSLRPLIYDMMDLHSVVRDWHIKTPERITFRASESYNHDDTYRETETSTQSTAVANWTRNLVIVRTLDYSVKVRAGVLAKVVTNHPVMRLGLSDSFQTLYELTPLSFVADWFLNLGDLISSWSPHWGLEVLASWVTSEEEIRRKVYCESNIRTGIPKTGYRSTVWLDPYNDLSITEEINNKERIVDPDRPIFPRIKVRLDVLKLVDLLIILKGHRRDKNLRI